MEISVHCHLKISNDPAIFPGRYVKAIIETRTQAVPALPVEAIIQSEGKDFIFVQTYTAQSKPTLKMIPVIKE